MMELKSQSLPPCMWCLTIVIHQINSVNVGAKASPVSGREDGTSS